MTALRLVKEAKEYQSRVSDNILGVVKSLLNQSVIRHQLGHFVPSFKLARQAILQLSHYNPPEGLSDPNYLYTTALTLYNVAEQINHTGRKEEADQLFSLGLNIGRQVLPAQHPILIKLQQHCAGYQTQLGNFSQILKMKFMRPQKKPRNKSVQFVKKLKSMSEKHRKIAVRYINLPSKSNKKKQEKGEIDMQISKLRQLYLGQNRRYKNTPCQKSIQEPLSQNLISFKRKLDESSFLVVQPPALRSSTRMETKINSRLTNRDYSQLKSALNNSSRLRVKTVHEGSTARKIIRPQIVEQPQLNEQSEQLPQLQSILVKQKHTQEQKSPTILQPINRSLQPVTPSQALPRKQTVQKKDESYCIII